MTERSWWTAAGGMVGLTWAAGLRTWMVELVGEASTFTWWTVTLILVPGALVGAVCGRAFARAVAGELPSRWTVLTPLLFASALLDPSVMRALVTTGEGSGALIVAGTGAAGGYVWSRRGVTLVRVLLGAVWALGVLLIMGIGSMAGPLSTPHGALVALTGAALVALLGFGLTATYGGGLVLRRSGRLFLGVMAAAAWLGTITLLLTHGWSRSDLTGASPPFLMWMLACAAGLPATAAIAAAVARADRAQGPRRDLDLPALPIDTLPERRGNRLRSSL